MAKIDFGDWQKDITQYTKQLEELQKLHARYTDFLQPYADKSPNREQIFIHGHPNEGYKFHLNVKPENVRIVAAYLKNSHLEHKFLNGGEPESGKVFTVYTGSKVFTERIVRELSDHQIVASLLEPFPVSSYAQEAITPNGEAPYAPNIYGRFVGSKTTYSTKFSRLGLTILKGTEKRTLDESVAMTMNALLAEYGDYFGGGIEYYQPKPIIS